MTVLICGAYLEQYRAFTGGSRISTVQNMVAQCGRYPFDVGKESTGGGAVKQKVEALQLAFIR